MRSGTNLSGKKDPFESEQHEGAQLSNELRGRLQAMASFVTGHTGTYLVLNLFKRKFRNQHRDQPEGLR